MKYQIFSQQIVHSLSLIDQCYILSQEWLNKVNKGEKYNKVNQECYINL